jgi:tripartite-type tricarboxylate transporter receptor subunit TctC
VLNRDRSRVYDPNADGEKKSKREGNMLRFQRRCIIAALALGAVCPLTPAIAQSYPTRPVTIIVPLAAGTGMDTVVRLYGDELSKSLGQSVVVDNRPGAATMIGTDAVAKAPPDGYTLLVATSSAMAINPVLYKKIAYDPVKDFVPISFYVKSPFILVVNPELPVKSVPELIKYAREKSANPLTFSSPGAGVPQHLSGEYMKQKFGIEMTHVPYRNTGQSITDIAAGHVSLGFAEAGASVPLIRDGKLRALAVSASARLPLLPEVPPFSEAANAPDFEAVSWHILFAPAATPRNIVDKLHAEMGRIMAAPAMQKHAADLGLIPFDSPPIEGITQYLASEREKWGALVKKLGLEGSQ